MLTVSNQSFDDDTVGLDIVIDGTRSISGSFAVEGQHNYLRFPLGLSPGAHRLVVETDGGRRHEERFDLPPDGVRYGVLLYWGTDFAAEDGPTFTWDFRADPPAFG